MDVNVGGHPYNKLMLLSKILTNFKIFSSRKVVKVLFDFDLA